MSSKVVFRAGEVSEIDARSGRWIFVDLGFSSAKRTCGWLEGEESANTFTFNELVEKLKSTIESGRDPINLVVEAPLSAAFNQHGNPARRSFEFRDSKARYWYTGAGCITLTAATYLFRELLKASIDREVRLFEGFVSFKPNGIASDHRKDVYDLRRLVSGEPGVGTVICSKKLLESDQHTIQSAFAVSGMDYGVPPVLVVE